MILLRALIALALCLSACAVTAPTATARDEVLTVRDYSNGGNNGGDQNHGGNHDGNGGDHDGDHGGDHRSRPTPSHRPSPHRRRALNTMTAPQIAVEICPEEFYGCPIADPGSLSALPASLADWISGGYECIDPLADLRACGGCASLHSKHDCTLIPGAKDISCVAGACVVGSCVDSYVFDSGTQTCIPSSQN